MLLLILTLVAKLTFAEIIINEIMYNAEGNDNNKEFIEIYSDKPINLSDFIIADSSSNDTLTLLQEADSDYYLITEEGFNLSNIESSVYSAGATIGNNLNAQDTLYLYHKNNTLIQSISYTDICGSGRSLEYFNGSFHCSFYDGGTPGRPNSIMNLDYSNIIINELFPNPQGNDDDLMPNGEFIELYNKENNNTNLAGIYFKDSSNHKIHISDTTTINGTTINSENCLAVYMNGFSGFLNNDGFEEITLYDPDGNIIDKVTYSDPPEALSASLSNNMWHYRLPTPNKENQKIDPKTESEFYIHGIEDLNDENETEFGDIVKVRFSVYKGDTTKNSIKVYIENEEDRITKITKAYLYNKFTNYTLTIPLFIYPNCNEKLEDGDYYAKVAWTSSSEEEDEFKIKVNGINMKNCDKIYVEKKPRRGTLDYKLVEAPSSIEIDKEFTSTIKLTNNNDEDLLVDISSYVYRGPKSYSGDRELNKRTVLVEEGKSNNFELKNTITQAEPGPYSLKIKIKREDQKTEKAITKKVNIIYPEPEEKTIELQENLKSESPSIIIEQNPNQITAERSPLLMILEARKPKLIYESPSIKSKKLSTSFLIALLAIYSAILTYKLNISEIFVK